MDDVVIYQTGLVCTLACALDATSRRDVAAAVNERSPTGISSSWAVSRRKTDSVTGKANPYPCAEHPGRQHWLLTC